MMKWLTVVVSKFAVQSEYACMWSSTVKLDALWQPS